MPILAKNTLRFRSGESCVRTMNNLSGALYFADKFGKYRCRISDSRNSNCLQSPNSYSKETGDRGSTQLWIDGDCLWNHSLRHCWNQYQCSQCDLGKCWSCKATFLSKNNRGSLLTYGHSLSPPLQSMFPLSAVSFPLLHGLNQTILQGTEATQMDTRMDTNSVRALA